MTRSAGIALAAALLASPTLAQTAGQPAAAPDLSSGRRHFEQSCGVCHTRPLITSGRYGPVISRESLNGDADVLAEVISNGVPQRMPGFKYHMTPSEIRSVVAYIKTLDPPAPDPKPTARASGERRDDN